MRLGQKQSGPDREYRIDIGVVVSTNQTMPESPRKFRVYPAPMAFNNPLAGCAVVYRIGSQPRDQKGLKFGSSRVRIEGRSPVISTGDRETRSTAEAGDLTVGAMALR
jgi:hypothetical protein